LCFIKGSRFFNRVYNCQLPRMDTAPFTLTAKEKKKLKSMYIIKHDTMKAQREVGL
jgi:hypothetical protein